MYISGNTDLPEYRLLCLSLTSHCQSTSLLLTENIMSDASGATGEGSKPSQLKIAETLKVATEPQIIPKSDVR